jgi:hypothetical protein
VLQAATPAKMSETSSIADLRIVPVSVVAPRHRTPSSEDGGRLGT